MSFISHRWDLIYSYVVQHILLMLSSTTASILNKCFSFHLIFLKRAHLQSCITQDRSVQRAQAVWFALMTELQN